MYQSTEASNKRCWPVTLQADHSMILFQFNKLLIIVCGAYSVHLCHTELNQTDQYPRNAIGPQRDTAKL
jgi:hypothetical protein